MIINGSLLKIKEKILKGHVSFKQNNKAKLTNTIHSNWKTEITAN